MRVNLTLDIWSANENGADCITLYKKVNMPFAPFVGLELDLTKPLKRGPPVDAGKASANASPDIITVDSVTFREPNKCTAYISVPGHNDTTADILVIAGRLMFMCGFKLWRNERLSDHKPLPTGRPSRAPEHEAG